MKVNFCLRGDGKIKPGGDTSKAGRLALELTNLGYETELTYGEPSIRGADVVHLVNLDLPIENLRLAQAARRRRCTLALSSVHHPFAGIREFYRLGGDRYFNGLRRVGFDVERAITVREASKLAARRITTKQPLLPTLENQKALADLVDLVLPMSSGERDSLGTDLGLSEELPIVPNGATFGEAQVELVAKKWDLVVVGRVEPRKNTLSIAEAARDLGVKAAFVGPANGRHKRYVSKFKDVVDRSPNLEHLGSVPNTSIPSIMARADVYLNAAWFEVVSQADVEAACVGARVASTRYSYARDVIGEHHQVDPAAFSTHGAEALAVALESARPCSLAALPTWADAARTLAAVYEH